MGGQMNQRHLRGEISRGAIGCRAGRGLRGLVALLVGLACGDDSSADAGSDDGTCTLPETFVLSARQMSGDCSLDRGDEALRFLQSDAPECDASRTCTGGILSASLSCRPGDVGTVRWEANTYTGTYNLQSADCTASYALELEEPF